MKKFRLTTKVGGRIRKIIACHFHAKAVKQGGCTCSIKAVDTYRDCTYCEAIKVAKGKGG